MPISANLDEIVTKAFVDALVSHAPLHMLLFSGPYEIVESMPCSVVPATGKRPALLVGGARSARTGMTCRVLILSGVDRSVLVNLPIQPAHAVIVGDAVEVDISTLWSGQVSHEDP